jgi:hypothetical protein
MAKRDKEIQARRDAMGPFRWWLKNETEGMLTFLDTPSFFFDEHNIRMSDGKFQTFTCTQDAGECIPCQTGHHPSYAIAATAISHKEYTDKKGVVHNNEKVLVILKGKAREKIKKQLERRDGDLRFCTYIVSRGATPTEASCGEDWEFRKRLSREQLVQLKPEGAKGAGGKPMSDEEYLTPYDYATVLAPQPASKLREIFGIDAPVGSEDAEEETITPPEEEEETTPESEGTAESEEPVDPPDEPEEPEEPPARATTPAKPKPAPAKPKAAAPKPAEEPKKAKSIEELF